jgi:RND superfamily putative drug exporter
MRRIVTWSTRGRHPWIVIGAWIVIAGVLAMGPKLQSVTTNDASRSLPASLESKRADAELQASFPDARGTPVIVVYSSDTALTEEQKGAVTVDQTWLMSGEEPVVPSSVRIEYSSDGKGALIFASLEGNPGEESFRDSVQAIRDHFGNTSAGMEVRVTGPGGISSPAASWRSSRKRPARCSPARPPP